MRKTTCSTSSIVPDRMCAGMASALSRVCGSAAATAGTPSSARNVRRSTLVMTTPLPVPVPEVKRLDTNGVPLTKADRQPTSAPHPGGTFAPAPSKWQTAELPATGGDHGLLRSGAYGVLPNLRELRAHER